MMTSKYLPMRRKSMSDDQCQSRLPSLNSSIAMPCCSFISLAPAQTATTEMSSCQKYPVFLALVLLASFAFINTTADAAAVSTTTQAQVSHICNSSQFYHNLLDSLSICQSTSKTKYFY